jgi:hypothetical protein
MTARIGADIGCDGPDCEIRKLCDAVGGFCPLMRSI